MPKPPEEPQYTGDFLSLTRWRKLASHKIWFIGIAALFGVTIIAYFGPGQYSGRGGNGNRAASPNEDAASNVIATVNDVPVTRPSYENQWSQMQQQMRGYFATSPVMAASAQGSVLSQLIGDATARSVAKKRNLSVSEADIDKQIQQIKENMGEPGKPADDAKFQQFLETRGITESAIREDFKESLLPRILADSIANQQKVTEADVLASYDEIKVRRILVSVTTPTSAMPGSLPDAQAQRRIEQILAKVKGGQDFAAAADEYTTDTMNSSSVSDPKTKKLTKTKLGGLINGGAGVNKEDQGWYKRGGQGDEFDTAAFALKKGEISGIVKTPSGYNIIKVEDSRRKLPTDYDKKKADYLKQLKETRARKPLQDLMEAEKKSAKIVWKDPYFEWRYAYGTQGGMFGGGANATPAEKQKLVADLRAYAPKHLEDASASLVLATMLKEQYSRGAIALPGQPNLSDADRAKLRVEIINNYEAALKKTEDREARFTLADLYQENKQDDKSLGQLLEIKKLLSYDDSIQDKGVHQKLAVQFRKMNRTDLATAEDAKVAELTAKEAQEAAARAAEAKKNAPPVTKLPGGTINVTPSPKGTAPKTPPAAPQSSAPKPK